jgi:UDP:flavonoid glycosyltransferase YjiC (YdhE family)
VNAAPLRLVALTFGTEGDSRPMIALCRGLLDAGHDVVLLSERSGRAYAAECGVPFVPLAGDMAQALQSASAGFLRKGGDVTQTAKALAEIARANTAAWMRTTLEHATGGDAIVAAGLAIYVGLSCAEHLRIPAIGAGLQPVMPTREFASPFLPPWRLPGWANALSHRLVLALMWREFRGAINDARRDVAAQPPRREQFDGYPIVCGMSPTFVPQPRDWPARFVIAGHWSLPHDPGWSPSPELAEFLARGEPPVYIGFGSMVGFDRDEVRTLVLDALGGRRALLFSGWSGFGAGDLPSTVLQIGPTPHDWLLPRTGIVVHHGGAGTTHAAARAGVPSIVAPFGGDQPFWADRLTRLGIAPPFVPQKSLTAARLRESLALASEPRMTTRARSVGKAMAGERGVANAVAHIASWVGRDRGATPDRLR